MMFKHWEISTEHPVKNIIHICVENDNFVKINLSINKDNNFFKYFDYYDIYCIITVIIFRFLPTEKNVLSKIDFRPRIIRRFRVALQFF